MRRTDSEKRILFCLDGHSTHAQEWMRLLEGTDWEVHAFVGGAVPPCRIDATFHTLDAKAENPAGNRLQPFWPFRRGVTRVCRIRFGGGPDVESKRFAALARRLRPAIVHSLRLQNESYVVAGALSAVREIGAPWIVSLWGSDLSHFGRRPSHAAIIRDVMTSCDCITADCARDLRLSLEHGAARGQLFFDHLIPGNGGVDLERIRAHVSIGDPAARRTLLFPHARTDRFRRFDRVIEAVDRVADSLGDVELVFLGVDDESRAQLRTLSGGLGDRCRICGRVSRDEVFGWLGRSRAMVRPSLSDGTPNVMLEAMVAGALPVMSPHESVREWIEDGRNGLLVDNEDTDALANAIRRAARDDVLVRGAAGHNPTLVAERADRRRIREQVLAMYDELYSRARAAGVRPARRSILETVPCVFW